MFPADRTPHHTTRYVRATLGAAMTAHMHMYSRDCTESSAFLHIDRTDRVVTVDVVAVVSDLVSVCL